MKLTELLLTLNRLKNIPRSGWFFCNIFTADVENVAQHSFEVAVITMFLADELKREGKKVNRERAISMAILHDWAESMVADFPYTARKYLKPAEAKKQMEHNALLDLLNNLPKKGEYLKQWEEYMEGKTVESKLVHAADFLSIMIQGVKYRQRGVKSRGLNELWRAVKDDLKPYAKEFKIVGELVNELNSAFTSPSGF
ncbi:MAG: HD domain-containing protein [Hadesarchaea archaeon]|nr:HD domain-containing protein [Hadesarchaea archaeon]